MESWYPRGFRLTLPDINCIKNICPRVSKLLIDLGNRFLSQSRAFPDRVSGKARHATTSEVLYKDVRDRKVIRGSIGSSLPVKMGMYGTLNF
jgi:hypothetical protein